MNQIVLIGPRRHFARPGRVVKLAAPTLEPFLSINLVLSKEKTLKGYFCFSLPFRYILSPCFLFCSFSFLLPLSLFFRSLTSLLFLLFFLGFFRGCRFFSSYTYLLTAAAVPFHPC